MRKDELVEFTWNLVQHYNAMSENLEFLRGFYWSNVEKTLMRQGFPDDEQVN
jgi:hypothetical protein